MGQDRFKTCLDTGFPGGRTGREDLVALQECGDMDHQKWYFDESKWGTPWGSWTRVDCVLNGASLSRSVSLSVTQGKQHWLAETTTLSVEAAMKAGVMFEGAKVTTTASQSLANTWITSDETQEANTTKVSCGANPGTTCLWQWQTTIPGRDGAEDIIWLSSITQCAGGSVPRCPPFSTCADPACSHCVDEDLEQDAVISTSRAFKSDGLRSGSAYFLREAFCVLPKKPVARRWISPPLSICVQSSAGTRNLTLSQAQAYLDS